MIATANLLRLGSAVSGGEQNLLFTEKLLLVTKLLVRDLR